ncbi:MAG: glycosyltransferase [Bacteroidota bacterium]
MVSVVIPAYNAEKTIAQTLTSVFEQTYSPIEIIVVNDGSTDNTAAVLASYGDKIKLITIENNGVSYARNLGYSHANGKYIQFLDSDDLLAPDKLDLQVKALEENNADVAYGNWQRFVQKGEEITIKETVKKQIAGDIEIALFTDFWCPPAVLLYSKRITEQLTWNEKLPVIQDARYLLDAGIAKAKFVYIPELMALYRDGQQQSLSQRNETAFVSDCYTNCKEVYQIWKPDLIKEPNKQQALVEVLRYCINRLSVLRPVLFKEAVDFLLQIEPQYIPKEKGFLRFLSRFAGYKNAEKIAAIKRKFKA